MPSATLARIVAYCDRSLRTAEIQDYEGATNGLQVEHRGPVRRIAAAVDASLATIRMAASRKANLLLVHHGLFWAKTVPWTAQKYQLLRALLDHDIAVYSSHLPLDAHPRWGNNRGLCDALGFRQLQPFFFEKGQHLGFRTATSVNRQALVNRLRAVTKNPVVVLPGGPETCRRIGVVTGGAGSHLQLAAREGVDTFITGEGPHWTYAQAEECGINVLYGGHYATETFGVKRLAQHLSEKFKVPWVFLDHPTGL